MTYLIVLFHIIVCPIAVHVVLKKFSNGYRDIDIEMSIFLGFLLAFALSFVAHI